MTGSLAQKDAPLPLPERRRLLLRLQAKLQQLRADLAQVREQTQNLLTIQEIRPLTAEERTLERTLRREAERLHLTLSQLNREVEWARTR